MNKLAKSVAGLLLLVFCTLALHAAERQVVRGHVPRAVTAHKLQPVGRMSADATLQLVIGLPLRNQQDLRSFLQELYTPGSPNFRRYLKPRQFAEKYGPTERIIVLSSSLPGPAA